MAAAGRPTGQSGAAPSPLDPPGWASAPRPTRSGGCAQTPPRITWPVCGSRSPAPGDRALGASGEAFRVAGPRAALPGACCCDPEPRRARGCPGLSSASPCPRWASSGCRFRGSPVGAGQDSGAGAQAGSLRSRLDRSRLESQRDPNSLLNWLASSLGRSQKFVTIYKISIL